jgi:hypothetical protein
MATGARGEAVLMVGDEQVTALYTNRALAEAERATGKTILEIARGAESGNLGIGDVAQLLHVGMEHARRESRAGGRSYTINDAWQVLDMLGFGAVAAAVFEAVAAVLSFSAEDADDNPPA